MAVAYQGSSDPKAVAENQRAYMTQHGDDLMSQNLTDEQKQELLRQQSADYLGNIYDPMAQGQGGYTSDESAAIEQQDALNNAQASSTDLAGNYLNAGEQSAIQGNPSSYTDYFNPSLMSQNQDVSAGEQRQAVDNLQQGITNSIDPQALRQSDTSQQAVASDLSDAQANTRGAVNSMAANVRGAIDPSAVTPSDQFLNDQQMSPDEKQAIITGAGISAGADYGAAQGTLERAAKASGASPFGVAAYRARNERQSAAAAGDAMTQARISADASQASRAATAEQMREAAGQYLTTTQTGAEEDLGQTALANEQGLSSQELAQANTSESQRLAAEQAATGLQLGATEASGNAAIQSEQAINAQQQQQQQYSTTTGTGIAEAQDTAASNRASTIAAQRTAANQANINTKFQQGMDTSNAASSRAATVANARLGAQTAGLNYYQGQNTQANTNEQAAANRAVQSYGTEATATNQAAALQQTASQDPTTAQKVIGGLTGAVSAIGGGSGLSALGLAEGGVVTEPTVATVGEDGPEKIVPLNGGKARQSPAAQQQPTSQQQPFQNSLVAPPGGYRATPPSSPSPTPAPAQSPMAGQQPPQGSGARPPVRLPARPISGGAPNATPSAPVADYMGGQPQPQPDGGTVVTQPTQMVLGNNGPEAVQPMSYRAQARVRPSIVQQQRPQARQYYGQQ